MDIRLISLFILLGIVNCSPPGGYPLGRQEYFIDMPIDHFASAGLSKTFKMRYFVDA